jgi:hypothetical protein
MERVEGTTLAVVGEGFGLKYCLGALSLTTGVTPLHRDMINTIAAWRGLRGPSWLWWERASA